MTKVTGNEAKRLGRLAESHFRTLCLQANFTVNSSHDADDGGWDFIVEIPLEGRRGPTSFSPSTLTAFVQVKGTRSKTKTSWPIALSNWEKHLWQPLPVLCCVILLDEGDQPRLVHLIHFDEGILAPVLEVLLKDTEESRPLNKQARAVSWGPKHRLGRIDGTTLREWILAEVGRDPAEYAVRKKRFLDRAGFGPEPYSISYTREFASPEEGYREMVDWALGLRPDFPVQSMSVSKTRFSRTEEIQRAGLATVKMMNHRPSMRGPLRLVDEEGRSVKLDSEVYAPEWLMGHIPSEYIRYRVDAWPLRVILSEAATVVASELSTMRTYVQGKGDVSLEVPIGPSSIARWALWRRVNEIASSQAARLVFPGPGMDGQPLAARIKLANDFEDQQLCHAVRSLELLATFANVDLQESIDVGALLAQEERLKMAMLLHTNGVFNAPLSIINTDRQAYDRLKAAQDRGVPPAIFISIIIPVHLIDLSVYTYAWIQAPRASLTEVDEPEGDLKWVTEWARCTPCRVKIVRRSEDHEEPLASIINTFDDEVSRFDERVIVLRAERVFEEEWECEGAESGPPQPPAPTPNALSKPSTT